MFSGPERGASIISRQFMNHRMDGEHPIAAGILFAVGAVRTIDRINFFSHIPQVKYGLPH
jgi:hypothetical protein